MRTKQHAVSSPSITPSADTVAAHLEALAGIPAYIRKLERKQAASEKSIRMKSKTITELEAEVYRLVSSVFYPGWYGIMVIDTAVCCTALRPKTHNSRQSSTSVQDTNRPIPPAFGLSSRTIAHAPRASVCFARALPLSYATKSTSTY